MPAKQTAALRRGWTTGACATAAAAAAYRGLVAGRFPDPVTIELPKGERPSFALSRHSLAPDQATAGVVKDAGDDPDVTHGAEIVATVAKGPPGSGVRFAAGPGVGTVTRAGLPVPVGEPAINPGPRAMIRSAIRDLAEELAAPDDVVVTISVPGGEAMAAKTTNARLGILGGISILGTTGIVIPYSCSSWIASIRNGIDVARAAGMTHVAGSTGRTSEDAVRRMHGLPEVALIDMGDFVGGMLKYLRKKPVPRLTIAGGFGKLVKLGQGALDLHSDRSRVDLAALGADLVSLGATPGLLAAAKAEVAAAPVEALARAAGLPLADLAARRAREVALATLAGGIDVEVAVFDRSGTLIGRAGP